MIELLITIAMIFVMATVAVLSFRKYVHAAQSSEAKVVMGLIRNGEESYRAEMLNYLSCSSSMTDYYPNANPNDTKWSWVRGGSTSVVQDARYTSPTNGWAMLNVRPDGPVRYGYVVMAGVGPNPIPAPDPAFTHPPIFSTPTSGRPWFVVEARNQHYNNLVAGPPSLLIATSYDGIPYTENEDR
jgi:type IV pilus assembly protein PilA